MWIRSQSGETLVESTNLTIKDETEVTIECFVTASRGYVLGTYETKEEALKVLDMLAARITDMEYAKYCQDIILPIFHMPSCGFTKDSAEEV